MDERRAEPARLSIRRRTWPDMSPEDRDRIGQIREEAFPPTERGAHDTVARRDSPWLWTAHSADDRLIGFATALSLPTARAAYLEYLAVRSSERGSGAGPPCSPRSPTTCGPNRRCAASRWRWRTRPARPPTTRSRPGGWPSTSGGAHDR